MEHHFRHMSVRGRLAFASLMPLVLAACALALAWLPAQPGTDARLLSGALLFSAVGAALVLLQANVRTVVAPLQEARRLTQALSEGDYDQRTRITRLDEVGELLVALEGLGDYLAVMLPDEQGSTRARSARAPALTQEALDAIAQHLCTGEPPRPATPDRERRTPRQGQPVGHLRLVARQA